MKNTIISMTLGFLAGCVVVVGIAEDREEKLQDELAKAKQSGSVIEAIDRLAEEVRKK